MITDVKRWHYFSGITLSVFIGFHLLNQLVALAGPQAHITLMDTFRKVYRHPVIETILLTAVAFQVATGFKLLFRKRKRTIVEKVQIYSGLYLAYFLLVHVGAVLYGRFIHIDTNFYYAAAGLNYYPASLYFIPYYLLAVIAVSFHVAAVHYLKTRSAWSSYTIGGVGVLAAALIITGFTRGIVFEEMPAVYQQFIRHLLGSA